MGKRILMLVGDFAEDYETMVPFQARCRWLITASTPSVPESRRQNPHRHPPL